MNTRLFFWVFWGSVEQQEVRTLHTAIWLVALVLPASRSVIRSCTVAGSGQITWHWLDTVSLSTSAETELIFCISEFCNKFCWVTLHNFPAPGLPPSPAQSEIINSHNQQFRWKTWTEMKISQSPKFFYSGWFCLTVFMSLLLSLTSVCSGFLASHSYSR